jgi:hypothetical protein
MTRACSIPVLAAVLLTLSSPPAAAQTAGASGQLRAAPTFSGRAGAPAPERISLLNAENHLTELGGLYVVMNAVVIDSVISPRLFTVRHLTRPRHESYDLAQRPPTLLLLAAPLPALTEGTVVQVTGWVATPPTAAQVMGRDWGAELDDDVYADAARPLIIANVVRSPDGVELASRP